MNVGVIVDTFSFWCVSSNAIFSKYHILYLSRTERYGQKVAPVDTVLIVFYPQSTLAPWFYERGIQTMQPHVDMEDAYNKVVCITPQTKHPPIHNPPLQHLHPSTLSMAYTWDYMRRRLSFDSADCTWMASSSRLSYLSPLHLFFDVFFSSHVSLHVFNN